MPTSLRAVLTLLLSLAVTPEAAAQEVDVEGAKDHPLVTRFPGFYVDDHETKDFDGRDFYGDKAGDTTRVEGAYTRIAYTRKEVTKRVSDLQALRNVENAPAKVHTDKQGGFDANMKLSRERAEAVVKTLVAQGVASGRQRAGGAGPMAPVASNRDEAGRAKNRRVELVEQ